MALCAEPDFTEGKSGELLLGRSLQEQSREQGPLPPVEAARVIEQICLGLAAVHKAKIVHGDVTPANVLLTRRSRQAMLTDFGIAVTQADAERTEAASARIGTLAYMAPEQYDAYKSPTFSSDIYGLGGTLLFALCGNAPHPSRPLLGVLMPFWMASTSRSPRG